MSADYDSRSLNPGDRHYRAYVGPPERYDLIAAITFNFLTGWLGLRESHRVLDIGCGSLRTGRLLIPYLDRANYVGLEPEKWLVDDGIRHECGEDQIRIKQPTFVHRSDWSVSELGIRFDYIVAQSIFSHASKAQIRDCLERCSPSMHDGTIVIATFMLGELDYEGTEWVYPGVVAYREQTIAELIDTAGLISTRTRYVHPKLTWYLIGRPANRDTFDRINQRIEGCVDGVFTNVTGAARSAAFESR